MGCQTAGHLKSEDFFGTEKFPDVQTRDYQGIAAGLEGNYKIIANLTIKETTKEVKFFANATEASGKITATGTFAVDRSEYNVKYGSVCFLHGWLTKRFTTSSTFRRAWWLISNRQFVIGSFRHCSSWDQSSGEPIKEWTIRQFSK